MRFLANENMPASAVVELRAAGHDVAWIRIDAPGASDEDVLDRAIRENRILPTFDKDFGELAWRYGLPATCGVVLFRLSMPAAGNAGASITVRIAERTDWAGHFSIVEPGRTRMRVLPSRPH
ncbi:DUF5615 family PIN-like protein [Rhodoplanes sp. TEM]|uniref:DUF5615 family PIN-like protein n=1 Tax=Rhodoplanes tepidamans TaxID=200616 RepID=A0ABT5J902_RHOTP|nr:MULTISPECIES: DUF5615 family PIN-like protein [Rhodoplanes]MDC7786087.1 DUF5615 family PIN-like protein [Rhodoplanes tepidamans]MDC7985639.1 DUF5615 family PIN-like protein [Rhodoplanes sp. TEM]MDQ0357249.1 putative nuclease of putative toxin-antitoxin system [Rhodoplanes tepidamans]